MQTHCPISKRQAWMLAIRPKTLPVSLGPSFLGLIILKNFTNYQWQWDTDTFIFLAILFCAVGMQAASNIVNDYIDGIKGHDKNRLGPIRVLSSGFLTPHEMIKGLVILTGLILITGIILSVLRGGMPLFILGCVCLLLTYLYSTGPRPLSHLALGELLAFVFFGPVPVLGTLYLFNPIFFDFSHDITRIAFTLSFIPGLFSFALMGLNNLRDRDNDKLNQKITVPNILPLNWARAFVITALVVSSFVPFITYCLFDILTMFNTLAYAIIMLYILRGVIINLWIMPIGPELNYILPFIGKFSLLGVVFMIILR